LSNDATALSNVAGRLFRTQHPTETLEQQGQRGTPCIEVAFAIVVHSVCSFATIGLRRQRERRASHSSDPTEAAAFDDGGHLLDACGLQRPATMLHSGEPVRQHQRELGDCCRTVVGQRMTEC
jgi:hypothetical protein